MRHTGRTRDYDIIATGRKSENGRTQCAVGVGGENKKLFFFFSLLTVFLVPDTGENVSERVNEKKKKRFCGTRKIQLGKTGVDVRVDVTAGTEKKLVWKIREREQRMTEKKKKR